jgi:uncharacterized protein (TIGR00296 family)
MMRRYTEHSAFRDRRFDPVRLDEVPGLRCSLSVITGVEPAPGGWRDWEVGRHGIIIDFTADDGVDRGGTFLPSVAAENDWDHQTTVDRLIRKAGYRGRATPELRESLAVQRYEVVKASLTFDEYAAATGLTADDLV